eukprot:2345912-Rhodomonas_salina.2
MIFCTSKDSTVTAQRPEQREARTVGRGATSRGGGRWLWGSLKKFFFRLGTNGKGFLVQSRFHALTNDTTYHSLPPTQIDRIVTTVRKEATKGLRCALKLFDDADSWPDDSKGGFWACTAMKRTGEGDVNPT